VETVQPSQFEHPAVQRLIRVARALGDLTERVVFVGGSIAPLLYSEPPFDEARSTADVDGIVASRTYTAMEDVYEALRARGFRQSPEDSGHVNRWRTLADDPFDLMSTGSHLGGSGKIADRLALETCVELRVPDGILLRHASGPGFLGQKWSAYEDRGAADPSASHDLQDIIALIASRPTLLAELGVSPDELKALVVQATREFLANERLDDLIAANLNNAQSPAVVARRVRDRLSAIARLV
jgi:hypothetical protein